MWSACEARTAYKYPARMIRELIVCLTCTYVLETRSARSEAWDDPEFMATHWKHWGVSPLGGSKHDAKARLGLQWHIPNDREISVAIELLRRYAEPELEKLQHLMQSNKKTNEEQRAFCKSLIMVL